MNREVETIREKVHTTADAALFLCFQEVKGSHSKGVIRLPLLHYDIPFEGYGEMLLRMNRIYETCSACRMQEAVCGAFQKGKKKSGNLQMK